MFTATVVTLVHHSWCVWLQPSADKMCIHKYSVWCHGQVNANSNILWSAVMLKPLEHNWSFLGCHDNLNIICPLSIQHGRFVAWVFFINTHQHSGDHRTQTVVVVKGQNMIIYNGYASYGGLLWKHTWARLFKDINNLKACLKKYMSLGWDARQCVLFSLKVQFGKFTGNRLCYLLKISWCPDSFHEINALANKMKLIHLLWLLLASNWLHWCSLLLFVSNEKTGQALCLWTYIPRCGLHMVHFFEHFHATSENCENSHLKPLVLHVKCMGLHVKSMQINVWNYMWNQ